MQEREKALRRMSSDERLQPPPIRPKPGPSSLEDAIKKRKAKLDEAKDHSDIESKIKSYKQESQNRPKGEDALMNALSKRRSKVEGNLSSDESGGSPLVSPVRKAPSPPLKYGSTSSPVNDGSNKIVKPSNKPPPPPPPTADKPSLSRPKAHTSPPSAVSSEQSRVDSIESNGIVPPPPAFYSDHSMERSKNRNREHLVETASVSSSQSSISTVSTMSTDPSSNESFEGDKQDNYDSNNSVKSGSSTSSSVVTVKSTSDHENGNVSSSSQQDLNQINDQNNTSSKPVAEWTIEEVADWLVTINMSDYKNDFLENEISGEHLIALTKDDLGELGVKRLGHKMTILKAVEKLS